jgi:hypothetical protein
VLLVIALVFGWIEDKGSKGFFFEKKKQKTFTCLASDSPDGLSRGRRSSIRARIFA